MRVVLADPRAYTPFYDIRRLRAGRVAAAGHVESLSGPLTKRAHLQVYREPTG